MVRLRFSPLFPGVAAAYSCRPSRLFGSALGCYVCIVSLFVHSLCFFCSGYFGRRCHFPCFYCFCCSGVYFSAWIACEGPCYRGFRNPASIPTESVCRHRLSRFSRGPIWRRTPYGHCDHIVVTKHRRVLTYFRTRPSRTVVTPLGSYSFCGRGVRSVCRADHRDPRPNSKVCLCEICGVLMRS